MKRVLDVGQCGFDHAAIRRLVTGRFGAEVTQAHDLDEALALLKQQPHDLVLVNRVFDADGSSGMDLLQAIKADPQLDATPVMLVTNYADHQAAAVAAGGEPGFGKQELHAPATAARLARYLGEPTS